MSKTAGRLRLFSQNWFKVTSDPLILEWIRGYMIPLSSRPNQSSASVESHWSQSEQLQIGRQLDTLLASGAIEKCCHERGEWVSKIFLVPKPDGSSRLILNLKGLNEYVKTEHFKLEDWKVAKRLISPNSFMATIDLKDAYHLVPVSKIHRKMLRFSFMNVCYEYTCLPFGLSSAPYVFTKLMKPVMAFLRKKGHISVIYIDDILVIGSSLTNCQASLDETCALLLNLGFLINQKKSIMIPSQRCKYLGFIYDSREMLMELPENKVQQTLKLIEKISTKKSCKIREFAVFIGTLVSQIPAVNYGAVYIKDFERERSLALTKNGNNFDARMVILPYLKADFDWWRKIIVSARAPINDRNFDMVIFSDASPTGWGAVCEGKRCHGHWKKVETSLHINQLELMAAFLGLKCFASEKKNVNILLRIDNTTAIAYVNRMGGSRVVDLSKLAKTIWQWCEARNVWIYASYIRSSENIEADEESRRLEPETEYELSGESFTRIMETFGKPEIDLFASRANAKCKQYISWFSDPESIAVDAFTVNWKTWFFYAFPPFSCILRSLRKIAREAAEGIVVIPLWETQPWFPLFLSLIDGEYIILEPDINLLRSSHREPHPLWKQLMLVVARLSGRHSSVDKLHPNASMLCSRL